MPANAMEYPKEARNTVNRKGKLRGKYDLETVHSIMQQARVVHVSFSPLPDDPFPVILPMIGVMGEYLQSSCHPRLTTHRFICPAKLRLGRTTGLLSPRLCLFPHHECYEEERCGWKTWSAGLRRSQQS
jgi:hypothetical protein